MEKPKSVKLAVNLLWAAFAIALVRDLVNAFGIQPQGDPFRFGILVLSFTIVYPLWAWINYQISVGSNGARNAFLCLFAFGTIIPAMDFQYSYAYHFFHYSNLALLAIGVAMIAFGVAVFRQRFIVRPHGDFRFVLFGILSIALGLLLFVYWYIVRF